MGDGRLERMGLLHLKEKPEELRAELQRRIKKADDEHDQVGGEHVPEASLAGRGAHHDDVAGPEEPLEHGIRHGDRSP